MVTGAGERYGAGRVALEELERCAPAHFTKRLLRACVNLFCIAIIKYLRLVLYTKKRLNLLTVPEVQEHGEGPLVVPQHGRGAERELGTCSERGGYSGLPM